MKNKLLVIALILVAFTACKKDDPEPTPKPINHFVNTSWEATSANGMFYMSFNFINETECKLITDIPLFPPSTSFFDYTFIENVAELTVKETGAKSGWVCTINGSTMAVEGRTEVFKRTK